MIDTVIVVGVFLAIVGVAAILVVSAIKAARLADQVMNEIEETTNGD